ncbi:hypothetical protein F53441_8802 [Fusarium austroafricanum]|uniref:Uncharacterized protein n=1 Tax=Fusarium austroafricanum TaxID=2364996 RepID=A0A8H4NX07_9HYPO|nr:hypothetical protein F53441_8802 [Fusarium austroafricanum]
MNVKNIANCGVKALSHTSGSITRSLCEPSARWKYMEDGMLLIRGGIEARCFSFLHTASQSVAEDGGFIEAQVFRAKGRNRRMPVVEGHRGQISFRFHYRSLSNLRQLSLAPDPTELDDVSVHMEEDIVVRTSGVSCSISSSRDENIEGSPSECPRSAPSSPVSDKGSSSQLEPCLSACPRQLTETDSVILSPNLSARPLPEIPVKKPVEDVEPQVLAHVYSTLSSIREEIEDSEASTTTNFPVRLDYLRSPEAKVVELNECEIAQSQSPLQKENDSTILGPLVNYSEQSQMVQNRAVSTSKEE